MTDDIILKTKNSKDLILCCLIQKNTARLHADVLLAETPLPFWHH